MRLFFIVTVSIQSYAINTIAQHTKFDQMLENERSRHFPYCGKIHLSQNYPNPLERNQPTTIKYRAIDTIDVKLVIYSTDEKKTVILEKLLPGTGEVIIKGDQLSAGNYAYVLIVNGRIIDRKEMAVTN